MSKPPHCSECHHFPSLRYDDAGRQCPCSCHDLADLAPALRDALAEAVESYWGDWPADLRAVARKSSWYRESWVRRAELLLWPDGKTDTTP